MRGGLAVAVALMLAGCLDSIVGGQCAEGWERERGRCRLQGTNEADVDGGVPSCAVGQSWCGACVDVERDPDHCGACGVSCASGTCSAGVCGGRSAGHVVLVGHDYRAHRAAAARLLGNAAGLGGELTVRIAFIDDAADAAVGASVRQALTTGLAAGGRTWTEVELEVAFAGAEAAVDVVLVMPRTTPASASLVQGDAWRAQLTAFVTGGGTVIGLEGPDSTAADFVRGSGLLDVVGGGSVTGALVEVVAPTDALTVGVPFPYVADVGSATFVTTDEAAVVATAAGAAIVVHATPFP